LFMLSFDVNKDVYINFLTLMYQYTKRNHEFSVTTVCSFAAMI